MQRHHGDAPRLLPGNPALDAQGAEITRSVSVLSTFTGPGEFGRMLPDLLPFRPSDRALIELGVAMEDADFGTDPEDPDGDNPNIPAGFTYFGQFVDHDITFDKTEGFPDEALDPEVIVQARTPSLDLDSLYGLGPELQPDLYEPGDPADRARFRIGATSGESSPDETGQPLPVSLPHDLPRGADNRALIGDPRNDENLAVAQTHLAFLQFHNRVLEQLLAGEVAPVCTGTPFEQARQIVRWHYQWIVLHDFVARLVDPEILARVLAEGRRFYLWEQHPSGRPFMPIEHSVAAYRLGHSMIRQNYNFNRVFRTGGLAVAGLDLLFHFTGNNRPAPVPGLPPGAPIPSNWIIDWRRFFALDPAVTPNASRKLDTRLANPLRSLPEFRGTDNQPESLAQRNLLRGSRLGLPSGQDVAERLDIDPLPAEVIATGPAGEVAARHHLQHQTPLWFYILKEAEALESGVRLGPVGSILIAEVFVGLLQGDPLSFMKADPDWKPTLPSATPGAFSMADLLAYVGNVNPLG